MDRRKFLQAAGGGIYTGRHSRAGWGIRRNGNFHKDKSIHYYNG